MVKRRLAAVALAALLAVISSASAGTQRTREITRLSLAKPPHFTIKLPHPGNLTVALVSLRFTLKPGSHAPKRLQLRIASSTPKPTSVRVVGGVTPPTLRGRTVTATALVAIINRKAVAGYPARTLSSAQRAQNENPGDALLFILAYQTGLTAVGGPNYVLEQPISRPPPPVFDPVPFETTEEEIPENQKVYIDHGGPPSASEPPAKVLLGGSVGLLKAAASNQLSKDDVTFIRTYIDPSWGVFPCENYAVPDPDHPGDLQVGIRACPGPVSKLVVTLPVDVTSVTNAAVLPNFREAPCRAAGRTDTCDFSAQPFNPNEFTIFDLAPVLPVDSVIRIEASEPNGSVLFGAVIVGM